MRPLPGVIAPRASERTVIGSASCPVRSCAPVRPPGINSDSPALAPGPEPSRFSYISFTSGPTNLAGCGRIVSLRLLCGFAPMVVHSGHSGTEQRDRYRTFLEPSIGTGRASKPPLSLGLEKTATSIGLPWPPPQPTGAQDVEWSRAWMPMGGIDPAAHYRLTSAVHGSGGDPAHPTVQGAYDKAKQAGTVRYLQAPYLAGSMGDGAGLDYRPTSSVSTTSLASNRQADLLREGESLLGNRLGQTASWTGARSLRSTPILQVPEPYLTTTASSYAMRPGADCQQHKLRSFITSPLVAGESRSLTSTPARCATAPLDGSTSLHNTRFLGVRDSDGGRLLIEVGATRAVAPSLPTKPTIPPPFLDAVKFVPSHPVTHNMATADATLTEATTIDPIALPRYPWPAENPVYTRHGCAAIHGITLPPCHVERAPPLPPSASGCLARA